MKMLKNSSDPLAAPWPELAADIVPETRPFIAGEFVDSASGDLFTSINPATGRVFSRFPSGCAEDTDRAVAAARRAFHARDWSEADPAVRGRALRRLGELVASRRTELAMLDTLQMGKPIRQSLADVEWAARFLGFYGELADKLWDAVVPTGRDTLAMATRTPHGVVGAIVAWNFPLVNAVIKLAPALAAGNCIVLKPSEYTAASALRLGELSIAAGIPAGVVNVLPGTGERAGASLAAHMDVDMLTFTGSTVTGRVLMDLAGGSNLKPVMLECGGKSPQIVMDGVRDLRTVARSVVHDMFRNQGQVCTAGSRLIVHSSLHDALLELLLELAREINPGDPLDAATDFGPLANRDQLERVCGHVAQARAQGAELLLGGIRCRAETGGYFHAPTIFAGVTVDMDVAQEEIFGPVLAVMRFDSDEEAISIANSTVYGLSATVYSRDFQRGRAMARKLSSGWVTVLDDRARGGGAGLALGAEPLGQSGFGIQGGLTGMQPFTRQKSVQFLFAPDGAGAKA